MSDPSECRPGKEASIPLAVAGPPGPSGATIRVIDAGGRDLGTFLSLNQFQRDVLVHLDSLGLHVWINRNTGQISSSNGSIFYEEPGCEGVRWVGASDVGRLQGPLAGTSTLFTLVEEAVLDAPIVSRRQIPGFTCQDFIPSSELARPNARLVEIDPADVDFDFPVALPLRFAPAVPQ